VKSHRQRGNPLKELSGGDTNIENQSTTMASLNGGYTFGKLRRKFLDIVREAVPGLTSEHMPFIDSKNKFCGTPFSDLSRYDLHTLCQRRPNNFKANDDTGILEYFRDGC